MKTAEEIRENLANIELARKVLLDKTAEETAHKITEEFFLSGERQYIITKELFPNMSILSDRVVETLLHLGYKVNCDKPTEEWVVTI